VPSQLGNDDTDNVSTAVVDWATAVTRLYSGIQLKLS
jgi:hypothetical protein